MSVTAGEAILDIGATQDLIGKAAMDQLTEVLHAAGLKPVRLSGPVSSPSGIGGAAQALHAMLVPISLGGKPGVLEMTVLDGPIPPLLSVGFLDFLKATIHLAEDKVELRAIGVELPLRRLHSGHRTLPLVQWSGGLFPVPDDVKVRHGLEDGAFNVKAVSGLSAIEVYMGRRDMRSITREVELIQGMSDLHVHDNILNENPKSSSVLHCRPSCSPSPIPDSHRLPEIDLQQRVSSTPCMGSRLSQQGQFDHQAPVQHERQFSPELQELASGVESVVHAGLRHPRADGETGSSLSPIGEGRARPQDVSQERHGATGAPGTSPWAVPPSGGERDSALQPACGVDGVSAVQGSSLLSLQEEPRGGSPEGQGPRLCSGLNEFNGGASGAADPGQHEFHGFRGDHQPRARDLQSAEQSVRRNHEEDQQFAGRSRPGPIPDLDVGPAILSNSDPSGTDTSNADSGNHRGLGRGDGVGVGCDGSALEPEQGRRASALSWPVWFLAAGVVSTSSLLTWRSCSSELQALLAKQGVGPRHYLFLYELQERGAEGSHVAPRLGEYPLLGSAEDASWSRGKSSGDAGAGDAVDLRPSWVPQFCQAYEVSVAAGDTVPRQPSCPAWQPLWRMILDDEQHVLENSPGPWLELEVSSRSRVLWWGLPTPLLQGLSFSDLSELPLRLSLEGTADVQGPVWAIAGHLPDAEDEPVQASRGPADLEKCGRNICLLARQSQEIHHTSQLDFAELFSPCRVRPYAQKLGLRVDLQSTFDLTAGWDARRKDHRAKFRTYLRDQQPRMLMISPECRMFSQLQNLSKDRHKPREVLQLMAEGLLMWNFSLEAAGEQSAHGRFFAIEHPAGASSWRLPNTQKLLARKEVAVVVFDMCAWQLSVSPDGRLSKKPTRVATNNPWLACSLAEASCSGGHEHRLLISGLPKQAQVYPPRFCEELAKTTLRAVVSPQGPSLLSFAADALPEPSLCYFGDDLEDEEEVAGSPVQEQSTRKLTEEQKRQIFRVHVNTGHPPKERFLRAMRAAGALHQVLQYIRDEFQCEACDIKARPDNRRRAQLPRTFAFNQVVGVDFLYIRFQDKQVGILNVICLGTSFHVAVRCHVSEGARGGPPSSSQAWRLFLTSWIRFLGAPQMILCDEGREFKGSFERGLEQMGIIQHITHAESPWENGKTERHGGWLKERLEREIESGQCTMSSLEELDEMLASLTAVKNRWINRGGYTPSQLVFGQLPRVPGELLSEDAFGNFGMADAYEDPAEVDEAAGEYRRRHRVQERARQLAMEQCSRDAVRLSLKAAPHQDRTWRPGQWVYVFRRGRPNQELHLRDRWVGPGIVVLANNGTVYVGMRSRLWRCSSEQVRPALPSEILGRELASDPGLQNLIRQVLSGTHVGAVDVAREGPPQAEQQWSPIQRVEDGVSRSSDVIQSAPEAVQQVPERLLAPRDVGGEDATAVLAPERRQQAVPSARAVSEDSMSLRGEPEGQAMSRHTTEEPAGEPEATTGQSQLDPIFEEDVTVPSPPGLDPVIVEAEANASAEACTEPPVKVLRVLGPSHGSAGASASASDDVSGGRAPGTPVGGLVRRAPLPPPIWARTVPTTPPIGYRPTGPTPVEDLSPDTDMRARIDGWERLRKRPHSSAVESSVEDLEQQFFSEGWSGSLDTFMRGDTSLSRDSSGSWTFLAKRNDEISLKELSEEERKMFEASDRLEWEAILGTKAVHILTGAEAQRARAQFPERILSSRMVRRKKPQPELHSWKAKSRWCLHGHSDPDTGTLMTYAPTPQSESIMLFLQTALNYQMKIAFADVKNAFCQSNTLHREKGPLFAEPCEGLSLSSRGVDRHRYSRVRTGRRAGILATDGRWTSRERSAL